MRKNRGVRLLLFPFLALVFVVGWVLVWFGEPKNDGKKVLHRKVETVDSEDAVEVGMLEKLEEEPVRPKPKSG
jgi:hypothetical protein